MSEGTEVIENFIFYYVDQNGRKYYTPSVVYAEIRADFYGTKSVFIEKN
jgi:hypothetical protein